MSITFLNADAGIDLGSHTSKLACENKFAANIEGSNLLTIREEAEIFFDEPVFSCVIAVPDFFSRRQRDEIIFSAKKSGFKNVEIITAHEAMISAINDNNKILVYDFGASKSEVIIFEGNEILDSEIINDVCGNEFDKVFSEWLSERFTLNLIDERILRSRAELIKIALSSNDFITWRDVDITRDDFERLIFFSIKRVFHTIERFINCYKPVKFIITGGGSEIPLMKKFLNGLNINIEFNNNLTASGAAIKAHSANKNQTSERINTASKFRELRGELIEIEDLLTRKQKDRLYFLFKQAEGVLTHDATIINLLENLIKSIRSEEIKN